MLSSPMSMSLVSLVSLPLFVSASLVSGLVRQVLRLIRTITSIIRAIIRPFRVLCSAHKLLNTFNRHQEKILVKHGKAIKVARSHQI